MVRSVASDPTNRWTAQATAEALERDPHTIGPSANSLDTSSPVVPPRPRSGAAGGAESGHCPPTQAEPNCTGKWSASTSVRYQPEPLHLASTICPAGILLQTRETGCGETGGLRGGVPALSDEARWSGATSLTRPTFVRTPNCGAVREAVESRPWWTRAARAMAKRPATIRRCAWRPARWNGPNWRGTATQEHRQPSWDSCGRGTAVV